MILTLGRHIIGMLKNRLYEKQTLVVVTHKPIVLSMVDRIIVLTNDGIAIDGTKQEVLQKISTNNNVARG